MCPVNAIRVAYTGELGWELHHPIEMQNYLFDLLEQAGAKHGMKLVGARAQNWLRQEKSYRAFGTELGRDATPQEADLPRFIDLEKDFHGKGEMIGGGTRLSRGGETVYHMTGVGCFAEYVTVSQNSLVKVDKDVPLDIAAVMGCAVLTGAGAVFNTGDVTPGCSTAVVGLGGVGLSAVMAAHAAGAEKIVAVDILPDKLKVAQELGATHVINSKDPGALEQLRELTDGGVDAALDFTGNVHALGFAYQATKRGGATVTAGLPHPSAKLEIPAVTLTAEERVLKGSYLGSGIPSRDIPLFLKLFAQGRMPVDRLMTHKIALDDINEGFDRLHAGEAIRQVIDMSL
jgi:alcohol dehydrogenase